MRAPLSAAQKERYEEFREFVAREVEPEAARWEEAQALPPATIGKLGSAGYLGACLPREWSGQGWDAVTFGLLNEALGKGSSSLTGVVTVQSMVSMALAKWGTRAQQEKWLPALARGDIVGAFALTEPGAGSSLASLSMQFNRKPGSDALILNGTKRWISCAQFAGLFLVFGKLDGQPAAALVPRAAAGLEVEPIRELLGFRAAGLAEVRLREVEVPAASMLGKPGFALSHVAPVGLHYGRISTACSALGLLRGCFEESIAYAATRKIGGQLVGELGMMRSLISAMGTDLEAASLLCHSACRAEDERTPDAIEKTLLAKYFTSRAAVKGAADAVQIRGASGCHASAPVSRYYRDAKITEIIEGTSQIHETLLGKIFVGRARRSAA